MSNSKEQHFLARLSSDHPHFSRLLAFLLGALTTTVFAPFEWSYLAPLTLLPLLYVSLVSSPRDAGRYYFSFGFGLFLTGTYWIYISVHVFGNAPLWIAMLLMVGLSLIMATFLRAAGWLTARFSHGEQWRLLWVAPAAWVLIEWLRGWILTGFPWLAHGYGQIDTWLAGFAPVFGIYGVSFALVLSVAAMLIVLLASGRKRIFAVVLAILPWLAGAMLQTAEWTENYGAPVNATIVQAGIGQDEKWLPERRAETLQFYRRQTQAAAPGDLVVWPEVAIPALHEQVADYLAEVDRDARNRRQTVLLGILEYDRETAEQPQIHNSVFMLGSGQTQIYRKRHLVPFGEYFPVPAAVREWMRMRNLPFSDLSPGADVQPLLVNDAGMRISVAICYEDAYGSEYLSSFPDADILVNVSNDAWFGDSIAPHQHLQIARMRALEFGRFAVRSTNTGISAFIGPAGELLQTSKQFQADTLTRSVRLRRGTTPYSGYGNWPVIGFCFGILGFFWLRSRTGI